MTKVDTNAAYCQNIPCTQNGDVAQLGERCLRKAEAEGSNPFISTRYLRRPSNGAHPCMPLFKELFVSALNIILLALMFVSGIATVLLVLMHSGKGTGVSDMIASSMYNSATGSGVWEKNLDRLTVITAVIFGVSICIMALTFPLGTV